MAKITNYPRGVEVVCSAIIENSEGKILLTQSPKWNNKWVLPGGHIEPGETILQATSREVGEETGLELKSIATITSGDLISSKDFHRPAHFIYFDVYCKQTGGKLQLDDKELTAFKWVTPKEALTLDLAESYPETIQKFIDYKTF
ncbi:MAG: NUDIX domain-containing protein [Candidatus Daviesbacteria bacterium]